MTKRSVQFNATALIGFEFLSRLLVFVVIVQLTNALGKTVYGELAYVFAIANLSVVLADAGIHTYTTRLIAQSPQQWLEARRSLIVLKLLGSLAAWLLTVTIVRFTSSLDISIIFCGALAVVCVSGRMFSEAIVRGEQRMHLEGYSKIVHSLLQALLIGLAIGFSASLLPVSIAYLGSALGGLGFSLWLVRDALLKSQRHNSISLQMLSSAILPFAVSIALNAQFNYLDSAALGWFYSKDLVGIYTAAYKPIFFMTALAGLLISAFFPKIVELWKAKQYAKARQAIQRLLGITMLAGWPMAIIGTMLAPWLIDWFYADEYHLAVLPFQILLWSTLCIFFWAPLGNSLQACGYERYYSKNFMIAALVNLPLTLLLVAWYGLIGAALATGLTQLLLAGLMGYDAKRLLWNDPA
jgi:O-antigen/teichoic acid export membrane protein